MSPFEGVLPYRWEQEGVSRPRSVAARLGGLLQNEVHSFVLAALPEGAVPLGVGRWDILLKPPEAAEWGRWSCCVCMVYTMPPSPGKL